MRMIRRAIQWIWNHGVISAFLTGLFAILPIVVTIAIVAWVVGFLRSFLGPESLFGTALERVGGFRLGDDAAESTIAYIIGWALVLAGIWLLGLLIKTTTKNRVEKIIQAVVERIPVINSIYGTVTQMVGMLRKGDDAEMEAMSVVYCSFGGAGGAGFLALLTSPETFRFGGRECYVVCVPQAPIPMGGAMIFVPIESCEKIDMSAEQLMRFYVSMGVMSNQVVPEQYMGSVTPSEDKPGSEPP